MPVALEAGGASGCPRPVEIAAYFVVSEALANVAKYARATEASVAVRSDGRPRHDRDQPTTASAAPTRTRSGLRGLGDRVAALEGSLAVESPPGGGTRLVAELPCPAADR